MISIDLDGDGVIHLRETLKDGVRALGFSSDGGTSGDTQVFLFLSRHGLLFTNSYKSGHGQYVIVLCRLRRMKTKGLVVDDFCNLAAVGTKLRIAIDEVVMEIANQPHPPREYSSE